MWFRELSLTASERDWSQLCGSSQPVPAPLRSIQAMSARYYTHFVTESNETRHAHEWSGVVELTHPLAQARSSSELRRLLARNFELDAEDIRILQLARVH